MQGNQVVVDYLNTLLTGELAALISISSIRGCMRTGASASSTSASITRWKKRRNMPMR